jgi:hypothetical protein
MADVIRIEATGARDAYELVGALAARGLPAQAVLDGCCWEVEISLRHEDTAVLVADVSAAVETWLDDRRLSAARLHVGEREHRVAAAVA